MKTPTRIFAGALALSFAAMTVSFATPVSAAETAAAATNSVLVEAKDRLYDADGKRVAQVYRVSDNGDVLVIYKRELRRIPAATLSNNDGKVMTSLTRSDIRKLD